MDVKNCYRTTVSVIIAWLILGLSSLWAQDEVTYGLLQGNGCPAEITAVAYPNYSSTNVTISTAVFTFLLPEGTVTDPAIPDVTTGLTGSFVNINGIWDVQLVTPAAYAFAGGNPADLMGNDVYQVVLQNSPVFTSVNPIMAGTPIQLFSFQLPSDCMGGNVEVLTNDSPLQQSILSLLGANFNNQMSMSINDDPTMDIYGGNDPATFSLPCPLIETFTAVDDFAASCEDTPVNIDVLSNDEGLVCIDDMSPVMITVDASNGTVMVDDNGTPNDPTDDTIDYTPNSGFTGTDQITYEICDINNNCSQAIINVTVYNAPTVNPEDEIVAPDASVDISGNPTAGDGMITMHNWSITDPGVTGITTSNLSNSDTETLTVDATGLSAGTVTFTYIVTDEFGCSDSGTSTLTINGLPTADDDAITIDENTPVNIDVLDNDDFGADGPNTGAISITAPPMNGTATVNNNNTPNDPTDDTIDYTPDPGFTGVDVLTYQICDSNGDCDDAVVTVTVLDAVIGVAKAASTPVDNNDGTFTTTITLNLENFGQVALGDIQVTDDLSTFGAFVSLANLDMEDEYTVSNLMITSNSSDPLSVNSGFNGAGDIELLDVTAGGTLAIGEEVSLSFDLRFYPSQDAYTNQAIASGDVPFNDDPTGNPDDDPDDTTDDSTDGPDPDPNDDDDPEEDDPTPIDPDDSPIANNDTETTDENTPINIDVLVNDDFGTDGPSMGAIAITVAPPNGTATVNNNGTPTDPTDDTIDYTPNPGFAGTDVFTYQICDIDGDCDDATVTVTVLDALIGIAKAASTPIDNNDGTFTTSITLNLENFGQVDLGDIQVTDDLSTFGTYVTMANLDMEDEYTVSNIQITSNSADPLSVNSTFNGAGDIELLDVTAGGTLAIGETVTLSFDLRFYPSQDAYTNQAIASGDVPNNDDPTGNPDDDPDDTTDDSTDGPDPDPNDDDDPEEDDPTPIDPDDMPVANDDTETTDENTPVTIDVLVNDDFGTDGPNNGAISILMAAGNGTAVVNNNSTPTDPTDDTIDYTPDPGFAGTDMFTYQICDSDGDCDDAVVTVTVLDAEIGVAKAASFSAGNGDGTFTTTITLNIENFGEITLGDVQVTDDLSAFGSSVSLANLDMADEYTISNIQITTNSANPLSINAGFDGDSDLELLDVTAGGTLAIGEVVTLSFELRYFPSQNSYTNQAIASGDVPANDDPTGNPDDDPDDTTDDSTDGTDPDPNDDDDPEEDDPTPIVPDDTPVANDDTETTDENTPVNIDVLVNDDFGNDGPNNGAISILIPAGNGTAVVNNNGTPTDPTDDTIDYTPDPGFAGTDMLTYQICDSDGDCDDAVVTVTVLDAVIGIAKAASTPVDNNDGTFTTVITLNIENFGEVDLGDIQVTDDLSAFGAFVSLANLDMEDEYTVSNLLITSNSANPLSANAGFNGDGDIELLNVAAGGTLAVGETVTLSFQLRFYPSQDAYTNQAIASGDVPANDDPTGNPDDDPDDTTDDSTDGTDPDPNDDDDPEEDDPTPIDPDDDPIAVDDTETTDENTPVNIDVLVNDDFGTDGPNNGAIAILTPPINGTAVVDNNGTPTDPTDDTIDYTPDPGFAGTDMLTYQICDSDGDCDDATVTINVLDAVIGVAKAASTPVDNNDGTFTTTITLNVENFGQVALGDIQVTDDLAAFGSYVSLGNLDMEDEYTVGNLQIVSNSADPLSVNAAFNGEGDIELLNVAAGGTLAVGETVTLSFDLRFYPSQDAYTNQAIARGDVPVNDDPTGNPDDDPDDTTDDSTDGTDPDPNDDDDPEEEVPTPIDPDDMPVAVDDTETTDENTPVNIDVLINDDFGIDGPNSGSIGIITPPSNGTAVVDNNGTPTDPTDDTIDYTPDPGFAGTDQITYQICDSDGDCDDAVVTVTVLDAVIGVAKAATTPVDNNDGTFTTTISLNVENFGQVELGDVQVTDDLAAFGSFVSLANLDMEDEYTVSNLLITSNSANPLSVNAGFNGDGDIELLDVTAGGTLAVGETVTLSFQLRFYPSQDAYTNQAIASGDVPVNDDPNGNPDDDPDDTTDDSTDGTDPDPNDDDDPEEEVPTPIDPDDMPVAVDDTETTDENTPVNIDILVNDDFGNDGPNSGPVAILTPPANGTAVVDNNGTPTDPTDDTIDYTPDPGFAGTDQITYQICDSDGDCDDAVVTVTVLDAVIGVAKAATTPVDNNDGTFTTTITLNVENFGQVELGDVQVTDDLAAFGSFVTLGNLDMEDEYTVSNLQITSNSANSLSINAGFDGDNDIELLNVAAGGTLAVGETITLSFDLRFYPSQDAYTNQAIASGDVPANDDPTGNPDNDPDDTTDDSTDGTDPDPNDDDDPEEDDPTPIDPNDSPVAVDDTETTDENTPVNIDVLNNDDFGNDGPNSGPIAILTPPANGTAVVNNNGTPTDPTDDTIDYTPDPGFAGTDQITYQICDSDGDCDDAVVTVTVQDAVIGIAKAASTPVDNNDGTFTTVITLNIENFGEVDLGDIQATDDLSAFGSFVSLANLDMEDEYTVSNLLITSNSANPLSVNAGFDGESDIELLDVTAGGILAVGETVTLSFQLRFYPSQDAYTNQAIASGDVPANDDPTGNPDDDPDDTTDDSTDGTDPDPNDDDDPEEEVPTPIDPDDTPVANDDTESTDQDVAINIDPLPNDDFGTDGPNNGAISILIPPTNGTAVVDNNGTPTDPTDDTIDYTPDPGFTGTDVLTYQICDSDGDCDDATVTVTVNPTAVKLLAKVSLQGALLDSPDGLMRDDLRSRGFIPAAEPYTGLGFAHVNGGGNELILNPGAVFANNGDNSIVDWVFVELRSSIDPETVMATRAGLVQRDGDIVDIDGLSPLCFEQTQPGSFYVAIRHRNHLGTMTASAIALTSGGTMVDFTDLNTPLWENAPNFDGFEQATVNGQFALWAGNTSVDNKTVFAGQQNDKDPIFNEIDQAPANILSLQTFILPGYNSGDVNLNGDSIYAGQDNDVDPIFNIVDSHPLNILRLQTFVVLEQLAGN